MLIDSPDALESWSAPPETPTAEMNSGELSKAMTFWSNARSMASAAALSPEVRAPPVVGILVTSFACSLEYTCHSMSIRADALVANAVRAHASSFRSVMAAPTSNSALEAGASSNMLEAPAPVVLKPAAASSLLNTLEKLAVGLPGSAEPSHFDSPQLMHSKPRSDLE